MDLKDYGKYFSVFILKHLESSSAILVINNMCNIALFSIFTFFQARELCFVPEIFQSVDI